MDPGDDELVERSRAGDVEAFAGLVARHQSAALRVAYALAGADGEDAVQEAFVKAHRALDRFRPGAPFRPWLLRIVANEARNRRRSAARHERLALRVVPGDIDLTASPEAAAVAEEQRRVLADAVAALPDRDREVIALRWFAGLTEAEMAVALDCRPGTVKSRLSRALERLRATVPAEVGS